LAATARARLMTLLAARGEGGAARKVASDYLRLHPHGPHERVARSLLSGNSP
jgi:hypothetical protein